MASSKGWSLDGTHWDRVRDALAGKTWTQTYLEHSYSNTVPDGSGIYLICAGAPVEERPFKKMYNCLYVGQSKNLNKRFKEHIAGYKDVVKVKETYGRIEFWYASISNDKLSSTEQAVIDAVGPSANRSNALRAQIGRPVEL